MGNNSKVSFGEVYRQINGVGHRPVNIRKAVIGQKGGWIIRCVF